MTLHKLIQISFWVCGAYALVAPCTANAGAANTIEIYEHYGTYNLDAPPPHMPPIVLQLPEKFQYGSTKGSRRNWGANILTYYPSFTSPTDPENANFGLRCVGICNGRILISVENRAHSINSATQYSSPNIGDFIARSTTKWERTPPYPQNVHVRELDPYDGFDEGFERTTEPTNGSANTARSSRVERSYFRKAPDGIHYDLAATCNVTGNRSTCLLHFSLRCDPRIYVSVHGLDGTYLDRSADIKEKTDAFISSAVQSSPCGNSHS